MDARGLTLITEEYRNLNRELHDRNPEFGTSLPRFVKYIKALVKPGDTVLNYGCGKCFLRCDNDVHVVNYDPAIEGFDAIPEPADIVVCTDVMEHIEPECLDDVLLHLKGLIKEYGFFSVATVPSEKTLKDGRNAHLLQHDFVWWVNKFSQYFVIRELHNSFNFFTMVVGHGPKPRIPSIPTRLT